MGRRHDGSLGAVLETAAKALNRVGDRLNRVGDRLNRVGDRLIVNRNVARLAIASATA